MPESQRPDPKSKTEREIQLHNPETLAQYEAVAPGIAKITIEEWRRSLAHRRSMERADLARSNAGLVAGLIVALYGLNVALRLGLSGHEVSATIVASVDLLSLVAVFIKGSNNRKR